ncbi:MAG: hypothetical protein JSV18_01085 [Candidatus Bathyarchaeota archaeon]|nr:MAG: hypothetical protein JSV18_01085 [Candidatus Bathyarchaeota archaeon]
MSRKLSERMQKILDELVQGYWKGIDRFGPWWKIFYLSMISLALVFVLFALFLAVYYIP